MKKNAHQMTVILGALKKYGAMSLKDAMKLLDVSESTVRRLFSHLEESGYAMRYHGGIKAVEGGIFDYSYDDMKTKYVPEKKQLSRFGASLVKSGETVYIDAGTTMKYLTFALAARVEKGEITGVKFFTNSLTDFGILRNMCEVSLIGGRYRTERKDFCGYMSQEILSKLHFSKCFIGADGFNPSVGFTTTDFETAALCDTAMCNSDECYILINSEKFMKTSLVPFGGKCGGLTVITDKTPDCEVTKVFNASGINLIVAKQRFDR